MAVGSLKKVKKPNMGAIFAALIAIIGIGILLTLGMTGSFYQRPFDPEEEEREYCMMWSMAETAGTFTYAPLSSESGDLIKFLVHKNGIDPAIASAEFTLEPIYPEIVAEARLQQIEIPPLPWKGNIVNLGRQRGLGTELWSAGEAYIKRYSHITVRQVNNAGDQKWSRCRNNHNILLEVFSPSKGNPSFWLGKIK